MGAHGKSFFIHFGDGWYVECQLRLHGHVVVMSREELDAIKASWGGNHRRHEFQLALVNQRPTGMCVVVCDQNKLFILRFGRTAAPFARTRDALRPSFPEQRLGYCPIKERTQYLDAVRSWRPHQNTRVSTFKTLCKDTVLFNGVGISHANEILHLAQLHPLTGTRPVMEEATLRQRLCAGLERFLALADDKSYHRSIPAGRTEATAFQEPLYITDYVNKTVLNVYRHTKSRSKIPVTDYDELRRLGYLDPTDTATVQKQRPVKHSREVQVYCLQFPQQHPAAGEELLRLHLHLRGGRPGKCHDAAGALLDR
jgi:formamidopyrimidine-DNA glycosylase